MSTYEDRYCVANVRNAKGKRNPRSQPETLYGATAHLLCAAADGLDVEDAFVLDTWNARAVAFYSLWTETIRPVYSANAEERHCLMSWEGPQARPMEHTENGEG